MGFSRDVRNTDDVIDSRDVIARIEEIEDVRDSCLDASNDITEDCGDSDCPRHNDDVEEEYASLKKFAEQGENFSDWLYGETFVRDSYWVKYTEELIDECYELPSQDGWPYCFMKMDYEAAADSLQVDYTNIDFDGVTYWARA
jgi:hypothetical protein